MLYGVPLSLAQSYELPSPPVYTLSRLIEDPTEEADITKTLERTPTLSIFSYMLWLLVYEIEFNLGQHSPPPLLNLARR